MYASKNGDLATVVVLLEHAADINLKDSLGKMALTYAAKEGHAAIVQHLIHEEGVEIDAEDSLEWTALSWAAQKAEFEVAKVLIANGADANHEGVQGTSILSLAISADSVELVKLLLAHKVDLEARNKYGLTPYVYALKEGNFEIAGLIKNAGGKY